MRYKKDFGFIVDESIGSIFDQQFFKFDNSLAPRIPIPKIECLDIRRVQSYT